MLRLKIKFLNIKYRIFNRLKYFVDKHASWGYVSDGFYQKPVHIMKRGVDFQKVTAQYAMSLREFDMMGIPPGLLQSNIHQELFHELTKYAQKYSTLEVMEEGGMKLFRATTYLGDMN